MSELEKGKKKKREEFPLDLLESRGVLQLTDFQTQLALMILRARSCFNSIKLNHTTLYKHTSVHRKLYFLYSFLILQTFLVIYPEKYK